MRNYGWSFRGDWEGGPQGPTCLSGIGGLVAKSRVNTDEFIGKSRVNVAHCAYLTANMFAPGLKWGLLSRLCLHLVHF